MIAVRQAQETMSQPLLKRASTALGSELPTGFVVMDIRNGKYFSLNETASEIWRALEKPSAKSEIVALMGRQFEIDPEVCEEKTTSFIEQLVGFGIVEATSS